MTVRAPYQPGRRLKARRRIAIAAAVVAVIVVLAVAGWAVLWFTPLLTVKEIRVDGAAQTQASDIAAATGVHEGDKLMQVDTEAAAMGVVKLPWVSKVTVDRCLPDAIQVVVSEHVPLLFFRDRDGAHLIDGSGRVFHTVPEPPPGVLEVTALPQDEPARDKSISSVLTLVRSMPQQVGEATVAIEAPGPNQVTLLLRDDKSIFLGSPDNAHDKGRAAAAVLGREERHWNVSDPQQPAARG